MLEYSDRTCKTTGIPIDPDSQFRGRTTLLAFWSTSVKRHLRQHNRRIKGEGGRRVQPSSRGQWRLAWIGGLLACKAFAAPE